MPGGPWGVVGHGGQQEAVGSEGKEEGWSEVRRQRSPWLQGTAGSCSCSDCAQHTSPGADPTRSQRKTTAAAPSSRPSTTGLGTDGLRSETPVSGSTDLPMIQMNRKNWVPEDKPSHMILLKASPTEHLPCGVPITGLLYKPRLQMAGTSQTHACCPLSDPNPSSRNIPR